MRGLFSKASQFVAFLALLALFLAFSATQLPFQALAGERSGESSSVVKNPTLKELENGISDRLKRVEEFNFIEREAARLGVRAWLFGGTAAGFAHYVKWDLQREKGDPRFQPNRFDYDYTNIFRSTQDLDIVIDGNAEQADNLQKSLQSKYPHLQGSKTAWEVRLLTQDLGDKQAILNNPDFMNQHTDSNSTGLIEITKPQSGESFVRDVRDWNAAQPHFLNDVHDGALHYYSSPLHESTKFAKEGRNPPILSAIRYLTKAFQYELTLRPEDFSQIKKVIDDFDPKRDTQNSYVSNWIEKNGKKLIQNAVNIEYAWDTLERTGLRKKLEAIKGNADVADSLAWWMNREPLRTRALGQGSGKTARDLGLDIVAHETGNFLAYESITRAHTGDPNVLISRDGAVGEAAVHGDGFYTKTGREGARGTGLTIRFHLDPNAREGTDFVQVPNHDFVIVKNKSALKVIPESLNIGPVDYFEMLAQGGNGMESSDRGILEKLKRRITAKSNMLTASEMRKITEIVKRAIEHPSKNHSHLFDEWFDLPASRFNPVSEMLFKKAAGDITLANYLLKSRHSRDRTDWISLETLKNAALDDDLKAGMFRFLEKLGKDHPDWIEQLVNEGRTDDLIVGSALSAPYSKDYPQWVETILKRGQSDRVVIQSALSKAHWKDHPEWVERLIEKEMNDKEIAEAILSKEHWEGHPEWVETLLARNKPDVTAALLRSVFPYRYKNQRTKWIGNLIRDNLQKKDTEMLQDVARYILGNPEFQNHPEWVNALLNRNNPHLDYALIRNSLSYPHWKDHPEFIETLITRLIQPWHFPYKADLGRLLSQAHWKDHPELLRLTGGEPPTIENLVAAIERGETVRVASSSGSCVSQHLKEFIKP